MRIPNKTIFVIFFATLSSILLLSGMSTDARYVAAPGLACGIMVLWLWMTLWKRDGRIPFFDAGMFCALVTLVYTVYPLVNYWVNDFQFGVLSDYRLMAYGPSPKEMGIFHLRNVAYLFSFIVLYSAFRGKGIIKVGNIQPPSPVTTRAVVLWFLLLSGFAYGFQMITGVNFNQSYEHESFQNNVTALASLPLPALQLAGKLNGILFVFKLALLGLIVSRCKQRKWLMILFAWIAAEVALTFLIKGARTGLVLFLMATALFHHRMIKPFSMKFLITSGAMLFAVFIFLGMYRNYSDFASLQYDFSQPGVEFLSGNNEFQVLLGNAYDIFQRKQSSTVFPWYLYINDFITILPPQQLLGFEKIPASEWYLRELGLNGTGVGLMWGVIAQSIVGLDWLELILRGAILGYILARLYRWYQKHQAGFLETLFYLYLCLKVYYTFRDTTFSLLANLVWEIVPFYILLRLGTVLLSGVGRISPQKKFEISSIS